MKMKLLQALFLGVTKILNDLDNVDLRAHLQEAKSNLTACFLLQVFRGNHLASYFMVTVVYCIELLV